MFAPPSLSSKINISHSTKMALVHNLAKALVRDITLINKVSKSEKNQQEKIIIDYFISSLLKKVNNKIIAKKSIISDVIQGQQDSRKQVYK
jgi:putative hydrolase of HD superfamily